MIYFENASHGMEGLNTHVMSWTLCIALANFLDRDFYFDYEIPCSTPPEYASMPEFKDRYGLLLDSPRSLVSQLLQIPNRRIREIDRNHPNKADYQLIYSYFATTDEMRRRFENTLIWDSFGLGRICLTREELQQIDLIEWTHTKLSNPSIFFFLDRDEKRVLLDSIKIRYIDSIEKLSGDIVAAIGPHHAIHLRLGDYQKNYGADGYKVDPAEFGRYLRRIFMDDSLPILIATDGLHERGVFAKLLDGYRFEFIDEVVFENYKQRYGELEFTDFNALSIINQLLCASADAFVGTYRSTFTTIIHRLRQERYGRTDFDFFPDEKVKVLLDGNGRIAPDRAGFFDWNRYSVFAENHSAMSWMREWNFELSAIDV